MAIICLNTICLSNGWYLALLFSSGRKFLVPKISMADSDVDDEFAVAAAMLTAFRIKQSDRSTCRHLLDEIDPVR